MIRWPPKLRSHSCQSCSRQSQGHCLLQSAFLKPDFQLWNKGFCLSFLFTLPSLSHHLPTHTGKVPDQRNQTSTLPLLNIHLRYSSLDNL